MNRPTLDQFTTEELINEIASRAPVSAQGASPGEEIPQMLESPDWERIKNACQAFVAETSEEGYLDEDDPFYIYEEVMVTLYGPNIFQWINQFGH